MNRNFLFPVLACLLIAGYAEAASKDVKVGDDVSVSVTTPKNVPGSGGNVSNKKPTVSDLANKNKQASDAKSKLENAKNAPASAKSKIESTKNAPASAKSKLESTKNAPASAKSKLEGTKNAPADAKNKLKNAGEASKPGNLKDTARSKSAGSINTTKSKVPTDKGQVKGKIVDTGIQKLTEGTGK